MSNYTSAELKEKKALKKATKEKHKQLLASGFCPWNGYKGKNPLATSDGHNLRVDVVFRDGIIYENYDTNMLEWRHKNELGDVMYYKVQADEMEAKYLAEGFHKNLHDENFHLKFGKSVTVVFKNGSIRTCQADTLNWRPHGGIMYYKFNKNNPTIPPDFVKYNGTLASEAALRGLLMSRGSCTIIQANGQKTNIENPKDLNWSKTGTGWEIVAFKRNPPKALSSDMSKVLDDLSSKIAECNTHGQCVSDPVLMENGKLLNNPLYWYDADRNVIRTIVLPKGLEEEGYVANCRSASTKALISLAIGHGHAIKIARANGEITSVANPEGLDWEHKGVGTDIIAFKIMPIRGSHESEDVTGINDKLPIRKRSAIIAAQNMFAELEVELRDKLSCSNKEVNPKQAFGDSKVPVYECSPLLPAYAALGKLNGKFKYGGANYIGTTVQLSTYLNAIRRHLDALVMGQEDDEVDGVPHIGAIAAGLDIILCARAAGTLVDDRLRHDGQLEAYKALEPKVNFLKELHKERNPTHYYAKDANK